MTRRARRFVALSAGDQWRLLVAVVLVLAVRVPLRVVALQTARAWVARVVSVCLPVRSEPSAQRIAWAVTIAGRHVPTSCLYEAVVAEALLRRYGYEAELEIGVAKETRDSLTAHAWVTHRDEVLVGGMADDSAFERLSGGA